MRSLPQGNIDSGLILLCQLVCGRFVLCSISIRCDVAGDFFLFCFELLFRAFSNTFLHRASKNHRFESKPKFSLNLVGKKSLNSWSFSLQRLVLFFSNFRFIPDGFTTRQKQYEQKLFHRAKVGISGHKGSSHASYLIGSTEIETLFIAFSPRSFRCFKLSRESGISA